MMPPPEDKRGWVITVHGPPTRWGHDGTDAMIITVPPSWYASVGGTRALLARTAGKGLGQAADMGAARMGRVLHHADWVITGDPAVVRATMPPHCPECDQGTAEAVAYLAAGLHREVALGILYLAAEPPGPVKGGGA